MTEFDAITDYPFKRCNLLIASRAIITLSVMVLLRKRWDRSSNYRTTNSALHAERLRSAQGQNLPLAATPEPDLV